MITIVKESGFCHGVKAAVHRADSLGEGTGEKVYLYGDLVNNQKVMERFFRKGFILANGTDGIETGTVVIRAHGVGRGVYDALAGKNIEMIDCTCVKVKSIHKIVAEKERVLIVGKKNHPEVLGILGWCGDGIVIENINEIEAAINTAASVCVVAQTTCNKDLWEKVTEAVKQKKTDAEIFDTLCDVTARRIENAVETAKKSDLMVVIGDKKSANSVELFSACKAVCKKTVFVSSLEELEAELSENKLTVNGEIGIVGSASAPAETIEEIHDFLLFADFHAAAKEEIESACEKHFDDMLKNASAKQFVETALRDLYYQNANGKRIRGALIKMGASIAAPAPVDEATQNAINQVAAAYEIFQTAILIHDDVIDKSETRRGKKTIHAAESDAHFGISRAICIGDYGLFLANKILSETPLPPDILIKALRMFSEIQLITIEGEIMDVTLPYFPITDDEQYAQTVNQIYEYKTAWYTIAGPVMLGAVCVGAGDELLNNLREITIPLGMAFQIKDDLLGIYASEKVLGKPALSDIKENKQTILYGYAYKNADATQRGLLDKSYGNADADGNDLETVREIFTATGAEALAQAEIVRLSQAALNAQEPLIRGLAHYLYQRSS